MSWSVAPEAPTRKYGPSWAPTPASPETVYGPSWFTLLERVGTSEGEGTLSADVDIGYPQGVAVFHTTGVLAGIVAPIKTAAAAFTAAGGLTATIFQAQAVSVAFSASTDGVRVSVNDGLWATITGGSIATDGLWATITGGSPDGLRASIYPLVDGLFATVEKV